MTAAGHLLGMASERIRMNPPPAYAGGGFVFLQKEGVCIRTEWIDDTQLELVLALLMPQNRLIMQLCIHTGLRVGDVVALRTEQLKPRVYIREQKTGKSRRITIPARLLRDIQAQAGDHWAFPGKPGSSAGHKTRQAVWADVKRAAKAARLPGNIGTHSARKVYAVRQMQRTGNLAAVQRALNHSDPAVTMIYAMADHLAKKGGSGKLSRPR